jgi:hypothetical protein
MAGKCGDLYHYFVTGSFMITGSSDRLEPEAKAPPRVPRPGRPRAIPAELEPVVIELRRLGYGYRAIARTLRNEHHINPDFTTVRRTLIRLEIIPHHGAPSKLSLD